MARAERGNEAVPEEPAARPRPSAPAVRTVAPSTSVDASSEVEGRLRCRETLRIDGRVKGQVECEKAVLVGEGARVQADLTADEVQISGVVEGNIVARRKITLEKTATVTGDLTTPGIVIEEGAKLKGRIVIGSDAAPAEAQAETESAKGGRKKAASGKPSPRADEASAPAKPEEGASQQPVSAVA